MNNPRAIALARFQADPSKCFQRHVREVYESIEPTQLLTLDGSRVERITKQQASSIILKYEWLGTIGNGANAFYGLFCGDVLAGACCFGVGGSTEARYICGVKFAPVTINLMRGACIPQAPKNAASNLIRRACKRASIEHGWKIFFAYSDPAAGEIGTVYQASNWKYLGVGAGRKSGSVHINWKTQEGKVLSSQVVHKRRKVTRMECFARGWTPIPAYPKGKYVWFEDRSLEKLCRYDFVAYPKRDGKAVAA